MPGGVRPRCLPAGWRCGPLASFRIHEGGWRSHSRRQLRWLVTVSQQILFAGPKGRTISLSVHRQKDTRVSLCL